MSIIGTSEARFLETLETLQPGDRVRYQTWWMCAVGSDGDVDWDFGGYTYGTVYGSPDLEAGEIGIKLDGTNQVKTITVDLAAGKKSPSRFHYELEKVSA